MTQQIEQHELAGMTPDQIGDAMKEGRLARVLGVPESDIALMDRARSGGTLTRADLARLNTLHLYDEVVAAHTEGRITDDTIEENR